VRAAQALGLAMDVQQNLLDLLADGDTQVRRTAAEVLGGVPTPDVVAGLAELLNDSSPRVRDAAEHALEKLQRVGVEFSGLAIPSDLDRKKAGE
jgi:HEAT repeat protein